MQLLSRIAKYHCNRICESWYHRNHFRKSRHLCNCFRGLPSTIAIALVSRSTIAIAFANHRIIAIACTTCGIIATAFANHRIIAIAFANSGVIVIAFVNCGIQTIAHLESPTLAIFTIACTNRGGGQGWKYPWKQQQVGDCIGL